MLNLAVALALAGAPASTPLLPAQPAPLSAVLDGEKATEWPEPMDAAALKKSVAKVRAASTDTMEAAGREEILAEGAAAAPLLMKAIAKERKDEPLRRLRAALDLVTTQEHTQLLAESLDHKSPALRVIVMRRIADLGDPGLRERAEALFEDIAKRADDPKKAKKLHGDELDRAAILALSTGSPKGLEHCLSLSGGKGWTAWRETLRGAARQAKAAGDEVATGLVKALDPAGKPRGQARVAALRLLAYAGGEAQARAVLPSLDENANNVKVAAVNALRMMVDGAEPLDKLSTFDAIERANKWKARL